MREVGILFAENIFERDYVYISENLSHSVYQDDQLIYVSDIVLIIEFLITKIKSEVLSEEHKIFRGLILSILRGRVLYQRLLVWVL